MPIAFRFVVISVLLASAVEVRSQAHLQQTQSAALRVGVVGFVHDHLSRY